jgi:hypothetical protein
MIELIRKAIAACYAAFERTPPKGIEGCPCCTSETKLRDLIVRPLRKLTARELDSYAFKAMTTIGSVDDFRYFWPRVAELSVKEELLTDTEVVFGKLGVGKWNSWPDREQAARLQLAKAISARFARSKPMKLTVTCGASSLSAGR